MYDVTSDGFTHVGTIDGSDTRQLWAQVSEAMSETGVTWLWTLGLRELLILTDWYAALEHGHWTVGGNDNGSQVESPADRPSRFRGYLVDNDPPNIILCRNTTTNRTLQMCDLCNFGIKSWNNIVLNFTKTYATPDGVCQNACGGVDNSFVKAAAIGCWCEGWYNCITVNGFGKLSPTAASQAMTAYRTRFLTAPILIHNDHEVRSLERQSYYPGRCEAYRIGFVAGPVYHLDIRSCYPATSRDCSIPTRLKGYDAAGKIDIRAMVGKGWAVIGDVTLRTTRPDFPFRHNQQIVYPIGTFRTALCGPELELAAERGIIHEQHSVAWYETSVIFKEWTDAMLSLRGAESIQAVPGLLQSLKAVTNNLYGAFAKRSRYWRECTCSPAAGPYCMWFGELPQPHRCPGWCERPGTTEPWDEPSLPRPYTRWRSRGWKVEYETAPTDAADTCVAVSAWVSSAARRRLLEMLRAAGEGNVYYCDTDSIWCNENGYDRLKREGYVDPTTPGKLTEVACHPSMIIHGHKTYSAGLAGAHCGVPSTASTDDAGVSEWYVLESLHSACKCRVRPRASLVKRRSTRPSKYSGGTVRADGTIYPLIAGVDL